jgi:hypothetical protein
VVGDTFADMHWLSNIFKALPLGLGVPLVIGAASIGPEEAASNLSKWAHWLGLHDLPTWLLDKGTDRHAILGSIAFAIIYSIIVFIVPRVIRHRRPQTAGMVPGGHEVITTPTTHINFPYVRALLNDDKAAKERYLFVENAKSVPMQGVEIVLQDVSDPSIGHVFKTPILYQDGGRFVPIGEAHTLRIGAGQYVAIINSLDGSFTEYLSLRMDGGDLKQKFEVFKSLPRGQGGIEELLLREEE